MTEVGRSLARHAPGVFDATVELHPLPGKSVFVQADNSSVVFSSMLRGRESRPCGDFSGVVRERVGRASASLLLSDSPTWGNAMDFGKPRGLKGRGGPSRFAQPPKNHHVCSVCCHSAALSACLPNCCGLPIKAYSSRRKSLDRTTSAQSLNCRCHASACLASKSTCASPAFRAGSLRLPSVCRI